MLENTPFFPDWISPPGDTISAVLEEREITLEQFAAAIRLSEGDIDELIQGHVEITGQLAQRLSDVLGSTSAFWSKREARYRKDLEHFEGNCAMSNYGEWLDAVPVKELVEFGWIRPFAGRNGTVAACLQFFGVPSIEQWNDSYGDVLSAIAFRRSKAFPSAPTAVAAWLRQGEILSWSIDCSPWNVERFRDQLFEIRGLTRESDPSKFMPELVRRCADCGVAVVLLRAPKQCKASGAARWVRPNRPMILLSGRHLSDDHFWFTFYHEAAHLILHKKKSMFVDGFGDSYVDQEEDEANKFAADLLIPPEHQEALLRLTANKVDVMRFARRVGISRGIVVGQLQHRGVIQRNQLNPLKFRFKWTQD